MRAHIAEPTIQDPPCLGAKCPVYRCEVIVEREQDLEAHFKEKHTDLLALGMSLKQDETGKMQGVVKDTLLS